MSIPSTVREKLGEAWIPTIYAERVRSLRTRAYRIEVPRRENEVEILFTLLGIEIKVGKKRFSCPDLATARYLRTFARLGCSEFAVPYDITKIGAFADEFEVSWQRGLLILDHAMECKSLRARSQYRAAIIKEMRLEIEQAGPGETMPIFRQSTKQRPTV